MAESKMSMPSGMGGLVRFKEEYKSKFTLKPVHIITFLILILIFRISLSFIFKS